MPKKGFSPAEVAHLLGVSRTTIYREINKGHLDSIKVATRRIITQLDLEKYLGKERAQMLVQEQKEN